MIKELKNIFSNWVFAYSIDKYKTSMFFSDAKKYYKHWSLCKKKYNNYQENSDLIKKLTDEFNHKGFTSLQTIENNKFALSILKKIKIKDKSSKNFWDNDKNYREYSQNIFLDFEELEKVFKGTLGKLLRNIYQCDFNIFRGKMLHSKTSNDDNASGSQLWHSDGNPGTCINVMFYITEASSKMGAIEILPWEKSKILLNERRLTLKEGTNKLVKSSQLDKNMTRKISTDFYKNKIDNGYKKFVETRTGDPGLICLFLNNTVHKGGFPDKGKERYVCIFQCYPSDTQANFRDYKKNGFGSAISYPRNIEKELR